MWEFVSWFVIVLVKESSGDVVDGEKTVPEMK